MDNRRSPRISHRTPVVHYIDNRGTEETPFGYVYFRDPDVRVWFAKNHPIGKNATSNYWRTPTPTEIHLALQALREKGYLAG